MRKIILGLTAAAATLIAGAAMAQPYGSYRGGYSYDRGAYGYGNSYSSAQRYRDSDRDGISDRAEWGRDRDRDGRPDQWDRYDNRRDWRHHRHHRHHGRHDRHDRWGSNDRYDSYDRYDGYRR